MPRPSGTEIEVTKHSFAALQRRITANHEAAHAVLALRFGIRIHHMAICKQGPLAGYVQMLSLPLVAKMKEFEDQSPEIAWRLLLRDTEHRAMISLAGPLAEARLLGTSMRSHTCESDLASVARVCFDLGEFHSRLTNAGRLTLPMEAPAEMANRLRRRTLKMLAHVHIWREVTALAGELGGWSQLTGHDAADTMQWTRRIRNQLALSLPMPEIQQRPAQPLRRAA
jgi:hypothetical protein